MGLLQQKISRSCVTQWGGDVALGEDVIQQLFDSEEISLAKLLEKDVPPLCKCWVILRRQLIPEKVLHEIAQDLAEEYIKKLRTDKTYADFRTDRILEGKRKWINDEISLGELAVHRRDADDILRLVSEHHDQNVANLALALRAVAEDDATLCMDQVYRRIADINLKVEATKGTDQDEWKKRFTHITNKLKKVPADQQQNVVPLLQTSPVATPLNSTGAGTGVPVGTILAYAGTNPAELADKGWLLCDGAVVETSKFKRLYGAIGFGYGKFDDKRFYLPDLRGVFLRGMSWGEPADPDAKTRKALNPGGNTGAMVGTLQEYGTGKPVKEFTGYVPKGQSWYTSYNYGLQGYGGLNPVGIQYNTSSGGALETRPVNKYVHYIIKYEYKTPDGKDVDIPIGSIVPFAGVQEESISLNWLFCDGSLFSKMGGEFKQLFGAIGFAHGGADEYQFKIPDYRGYFLRGVAQPGGRDKGVETRTYPNPSGPNGYKGNDKAGVGSVQQDTTALPKTPFVSALCVPTGNTLAEVIGGLDTLVDYNPSSIVVDVTQAGGDAESRPINISVNWFIRFR